MSLQSQVLAVLLATMAAVPAGCSRSEPRSPSKREVRVSMDTIVAVQADGESAETASAAVAAAWQEMERCLKVLDWWQPGTDISRVNEAAGGEAIPVSPVLLECLQDARQVHELSGGAFDPTVGPLVDVWRQEGKQGRVPSDAQISEALTRIGFRQVELRPAPPPAGDAAGKAVAACTVRLPRKGMRLDLGAIAKGYIAQRMMETMKRAGICGAMVQAGGEVRVFGLRQPGGDEQADGRWRVAVQDPRYPDDQSRHYTVLRLTNRAVSTSGHYQRYRIIDGKRYSHIVDPRTGRPVPTGLASVTVVAPEGYLADGLSTAIAVLGIEKGLQLVESLPDVECLLLEESSADEATGVSGTGGRETGEVKLIAHRSGGFAALEAGGGRGQAEWQGE